MSTGAFARNERSSGVIFSKRATRVFFEVAEPRYPVGVDEHVRSVGCVVGTADESCGMRDYGQPFLEHEVRVVRGLVGSFDR